MKELLQRFLVHLEALEGCEMYYFKESGFCACHGYGTEMHSKECAAMRLWIETVREVSQ